MDNLTEEEKKILQPFMTNTDKPVFVLTNLPEVVKGALFSRYSRSTKSLRRVLLDEFILQPETGFREIVGHQENKGTEQHVAIKKAEEFYDRVLVGYGDDSVAELAGAHMAIEDVSNIATKAIQDSRIGLSPLEKSTRYVYFDQKPQGGWLYYKEKAITQSDFAKLYTGTCDSLFETYARLIPKLSSFFEERHPKDAAVSDRAYASTIRAKTCDVLRGLLPASTITNMGTFGDGRAYEYLITKMYSSELSEISTVASLMHSELQKVMPSFVKRAGGKYGKEQQDYFAQTDKRMFALAKKHGRKTGTGKEVTLVDYDRDGEKKIVAHILYQYVSLSLLELLEIAHKMGESERKELIDAYAGTRSNRRHKPGRAFESTYYTFDILANYGAYRDLHRHRILTQERQLLSCNHGYTLPKEIVEAGYESEFKGAMEKAKHAYDEIAKKMPKEAQYAVPFAYNIRWYVKMNLREAIHFCELRSMQQGHIDYRKVAQEMYGEIKRVHPNLGKHMVFMDMKEYAFERLEAEKKLDKKLEEIKKKYGN